MNRRSFFGRLAALAAAGLVIPKWLQPKPKRLVKMRVVAVPAATLADFEYVSHVRWGYYDANGNEIETGFWPYKS